jgi:hypothetical protein
MLTVLITVEKELVVILRNMKYKFFGLISGQEPHMKTELQKFRYSDIKFT